MASPNDRYYTYTHEWAKLDPADGLYYVGVTAYRAAQLGTVTAVSMLVSANSNVTSGKAIASLTNTNNVSGDVHSPMAGIVRNEFLLDRTGQSPNDTVTNPYGTNLFKLQSSSQDYAALLTAAQYDSYLGSIQE